MDGHRFVSALFYALIGFDTLISKSTILYALSLPSSSSLSSSLMKHGIPQVTSVLDEQQQNENEKSTNNGNKSEATNNIGRNSVTLSKMETMCKISEWKCPNGTCIPLSSYCNGIPDCVDKSDEPNECSGE